MADTPAQDRNLPASQRKLDKARAEGQVARSRDLGHFAAVAGGGALLVLAATPATAWLRELLAASLTFDVRSLAGPAPMVERLGEAALRMMALLLPIGLGMAALALASKLYRQLAEQGYGRNGTQALFKFYEK